MKLNKKPSFVGGILIGVAFSLSANAADVGGRTGFHGGHYKIQYEDTLNNETSPPKRHEISRPEKPVEQYRFHRPLELHIDYSAPEEDYGDWKPGHMRLLNTHFRD